MTQQDDPDNTQKTLVTNRIAESKEMAVMKTGRVPNLAVVLWEWKFAMPKPA